MSETIARVRMVKRWNNLFPGDLAVFPLGAARELVANRYAEALPPPDGVAVPGETSPSPTPQRAPGSIVRK